MGFNTIGKTMITLGLLLIIAGGLMMIFTKLGLGRLPGDIFLQRGKAVFYFPMATSIILSLILTLILNFVIRR